MGSVEEVELEAHQGPQQPAVAPRSHQQEPTVSSFPQLGQAWAVGGVWYEVLPLDEVDPEEEGYVLLPASGGQPARAATSKSSGSAQTSGWVSASLVTSVQGRMT